MFQVSCPICQVYFVLCVKCLVLCVKCLLSYVSNVFCPMCQVSCPMCQVSCSIFQVSFVLCVKCELNNSCLYLLCILQILYLGGKNWISTCFLNYPGYDLPCNPKLFIEGCKYCKVSIIITKNMK
jgi:hypothetical protein